MKLYRSNISLLCVPKQALASKGLRTTDPRLKESMHNFRLKFARGFPDGLHDCMLDQEAFKE